MPASPERADIAVALAAAIARDGPMPLDRFMGAANAFYYATHGAIGAAGDFTTAPEVSQMFGELAGLALADLWQRAGRPPTHFVELGPGRGTLAADARRAMARAGLAPALHLVETSPRLRAEQAALLPGATWHDTIDTLPAEGALLVVANEFFDALPVRQLIRTEAGWRERLVTHRPGGFALETGEASEEAAVHPALRGADPGGIVELRPAAAAIVAALAGRLAQQGGALLAIDYGYGDGHGDTLQAVRAHAPADPLARPGASDLTAHVDFAALAQAAAAAAPVRIAGPVAQGQWLAALGLAGRAAALARANPAAEATIAAAYRRLAHADEMGALFKVMAVVAGEWPSPAGFG